MAESSRDCETLEEGGFTNGVWWVLPDWEEWREVRTGKDKKRFYTDTALITPEGS
jgi:hypothetical protein